jgi:hypothetical protein
MCQTAVTFLVHQMVRECPVLKEDVAKKAVKEEEELKVEFVIDKKRSKEDRPSELDYISL